MLALVIALTSAVFPIEPATPPKEFASDPTILHVRSGPSGCSFEQGHWVLHQISDLRGVIASTDTVARSQPYRIVIYRPLPNACVGDAIMVLISEGFSQIEIRDGSSH